MSARETKTEGRRATCTPWIGGNGLKLHRTERKAANKATRRRARRALRREVSSETESSCLIG